MPPTESSELPTVTGTFLQRMECGHGSLSNSDRLPTSLHLGHTKLTVPPLTLG